MTRSSFNFKCLLICFVFWGNILYAQEPIKKYPSLLWEISGPGITKPSYVYGTMHVSSKLAFHLGDSFFMALNNCDVVALESDPSQWLTQMLDSAYLEEAGGLYRSSSSYSDFYRDAFSIEELDKRMISSSLNISGRMMNGMLYRHSGSNTDFEEDTYLDMYIFQAGKKWNKTVIGLEDFLESERMVRLSQLPDDDEEDRPVNKDYRKMIRSGKSPAEQLEDAYRNEDLDMVDSIQRIMSPSKNHQKYMLQLRNEVMANAMDSIIKLNKSIFSGIGAAHLAGNNGVIELLRAKGYTVRPVTRLIGEVSKDYREKLEKTYITHPLSTFTTADEWMSVNLPGNLVELPSNGDYKIYLYPDMANGTIYSLVRLRHHTHLLNQKSSYIIKRIDSLLYENIPGKIISQKDISQNGYPGFDIINRSKKGNYERYKILVTPMEIVIFKVGGTLDFLKDNNNLDAVFNTFQIQSNRAAWKTVSSTFGFDINMPGIPFLEEKNKLLTPLLASDVQILSYDASNNYYGLKRVGLHDYEYIEEDTFELSYLANEFNTSLKLEGVSRFWDSVTKHPALRISAKDSVGFLHSMYVIDGPRYYQILAKTSDSIWPSAYFNSFKITKAQYNTSKLFVDSFAFYAVNTPTKPAGWSSFRVLETKQKMKEDDDSYLGNSLTRTFCNTKSDEQVSVEYQQFPKYYFCPTYDSLWRLLKEEYVVSGLLVKQETVSRDSNVYDIVLGDTNSAREIVTRYIVNNNVLYTLQTLVDQNEFEQSPFLSQFWSTFTPNNDTVTGLPFNQNKADIFLNDLLKGDSLIQIQAINSLYQIDFENHHAPELINLVESYKNPEFTLENRIALIEELGQLKHKTILPYLNLVYHRCIDTPQLQIAVLQALIYHKSNAANKQFKELLDSETPLVSEYLVGSLFGSMYDSLEIYKDMFPFLLRFTPYPEYKFNLYGLMATMLDSGVIKPMKYKKYKNELVREAKDALKRLMATGLAEDLYSDEYGDMGYDEESSESHISAFNSLLIPFKSDKNVQEYFNRTKRLNSEEDLFLSSLLFLKEGISVNDTIWTFFANNDDYRIRLYRGLEKLNKLNLMPDSTKTQTLMAQSFLYADVYVEPNDSVHLVRKLTLETKKGNGYLYVFKRKDNYNDKLWKFDVIGSMPIDSSIIPKKCETRSLGFEYIDDEEMDKKLDDILKTVKYADRERVKVKGRRYDELDYGY